MDAPRRRDLLVRLLRRRSHATVAELAALLETSPRTVARDLALLRERGFRIDGSAGRGGGVRLDPSSVLLTTTLSSDEMVALLLALAFARATPWTPFAARAEIAVAKIERVLPGERVRELRRLLRRVLIGPPARGDLLGTLSPVDPSLVAAFERAFTARRALRFDYTAADGRRSRRCVEPHGLFVRAPLWYILAWDPRRRAPRTFRMDRVRRPRVVEEQRFAPRPIDLFDGVCPHARPLLR